MENKNILLDLIKSKCIEANKSILELKFGCKLIFQGNELTIIDSTSVNQGDYKVIYKSGFTEIYPFDLRLDEIEILGRPITLVDVLLAIRKADISGFYINRFGQMEAKGKDNGGITWDLTKNLEEQSEEVLVFLSELLKEMDI